MIVVDSNVIAYCWIRGPLTPLAQRVRVANPEWHVPVLWRSELRSILTGYLRSGALAISNVERIMTATEVALAGREHLIASAGVFDVIQGTALSPYDAEFVALARAMSAPLITADRAVLRAAADVALTMEGYLAQ